MTYCGHPSYLEVQDDRPNQSKDEFWIAIDDVLCSDVDKADLASNNLKQLITVQFYLSFLEEIQRELHILNPVYSVSSLFSRLKLDFL